MSQPGPWEPNATPEELRYLSTICGVSIGGSGGGEPPPPPSTAGSGDGGDSKATAAASSSSSRSTTYYIPKPTPNPDARSLPAFLKSLNDGVSAFVGYVYLGHTGQVRCVRVYIHKYMCVCMRV